MVTTSNYCQIAANITGRLLSFEQEDSVYNKYGIGTGTLLLNEDSNAQLIKITGTKLMNDTIKEFVGKSVVLSGFVRNYRKDSERYNVFQIYTIEENKNNSNINSVTATCEVIGVTAIKDKKDKNITRAVQIFLLTNEKYDKHTRLRGVIFNANNNEKFIELPTIGKKYNISGYLQANRFYKGQFTDIGGQLRQAWSGELELVINTLSEVDETEVENGVKECANQ